MDAIRQNYFPRHRFVINFENSTSITSLLLKFDLYFFPISVSRTRYDYHFSRRVYETYVRREAEKKKEAIILFNRHLMVVEYLLIDTCKLTRFKLPVKLTKANEKRELKN